MTRRMLIDASHVEETRVALIDSNNRLVDYDYESKVRKQLKGSVFLAKITRVEPSLQAAFVNFGGNRHGFLPFSEIHTDYYRIPIADREALLAEQEKELAEKAAADEAEEEAAAQNEAADEDDDEDDEDEVDEVGGDLAVSEDDEDEAEDKAKKGKSKRGGRRGRRRSSRSQKVEIVGGNSMEGKALKPSIRKNYKIQEVIKRGQIMLVQVSKEERGNKGAAVTTYLSLPGRYCVLMPNSPRAGGVSRKIANNKDRRRLRDILKDLQVPAGMSVIMRTAGVARNKPDIKRDLDYLTRLWDNIRDLTLKSTAPAVIHEEGNLIRRSIRDIYSRDVKEVLVAGDEGYKTARDFMKMIIPSHARRVKQYKEEKIPLFQRYHVEGQINEIGSTTVTLPSGGYIVINPTEALVSVDVNSGRATKGRHIEETALRTNQESAEEVARQLRLRDLGGLVVIDFIDMEDRRNNRRVENKLKEALSSDRARIQVGRISSFGLLELSRQRLNPSLTEAQYEKCSHCDGAGIIRTTDSASIMALRALEEEGVKDRAEKIALYVPNDIALYILNNKREWVEDIERRYGFSIKVEVDESLPPSKFKIEILSRQSDEKETGATEEAKETKEEDKSDNRKKGRSRGGRRRGRRGGRRRGGGQSGDNAGASSGDKKEEAAKPQKKDEKSQDSEKKQKPDEKEAAQKAGEKEKASANKKAGDKKASGKDKEEEKKEDKKKPTRSRARKSDKSSAKTESKPKKTSSAAAKKKSVDESKSADKAKKSAGSAEKKPSAPKASNDASPAREYETVNQPPPKKKKGWWSKD